MGRIPMDNDLISRSALMDSLGASDRDIYCKEIIEDAPGVDAAPVVHAQWKHSASNDRAYDYCSACRCGTMRRTYGYNPDGREYVTEQSYSYCPRCGARMDEKETDNGQ
jgi:hypothetical protein